MTTSRTVVITQSNYLPWRGYFDLINSADDLVLYDDMQFTRRDWRNRNRIKTPQGAQWLTVPVSVKGKFDQRINETVVSEPTWNEQHWVTIEQNYRKAPQFGVVGPLLKHALEECTSRYLSEINEHLLKVVAAFLGISTRFHQSNQFTLAEDRTKRLVDICKALGGTRYITGPAARAYMNEPLFADEGIELVYFDYSAYPPYNQPYGEFIPDVSCIDLLFNVGTDAPRFMKSFQFPTNENGGL